MESDIQIDGYAQLPTNSNRCPVSGLKRNMLYKLLPLWRTHPTHPVHVMELKEPGAKRGITLYKLSDVMRLLDHESEKQASVINQ